MKGQQRQGEKDEEGKGGRRKEEKGKREKIPYWHLFCPLLAVVFTSSGRTDIPADPTRLNC